MSSHPDLEGPESFPEYHETIWQNWLNESGGCAECPNLDCAHDEKPAYGGGSIPSDIAIVAETPNQTRYTKDSETQGSPTSTLGAREYWGGLNTSWKMFSQFITPLIDDRVAGYDRNDIYYTNIKKCGDIRKREIDSGDTKAKINKMNQDAKEQCATYLEKELEEVEPTVVIVVKAALTGVNAIYNKVPKDKFKNVALKAHGEEPPYIIPTYHWSNLRFNYKHPEVLDLDSENAGKAAYWDVLAATLEDCLAD